MKIQTLLIPLLFFVIGITKAQADSVTDIEDFVSNFKEYVSKKDAEAILNLNYWSGLSQVQQNSIETSFEQIVKEGVNNIQVEYIQNGHEIEFRKKERVFSPNLPPIAKVSVEINTGKEFRGGYSFYIGRDGDMLKFSHVVLRKSS